MAAPMKQSEGWRDAFVASARAANALQASRGKSIADQGWVRWMDSHFASAVEDGVGVVDHGADFAR